ncbi:MAG: hypothetical protein KBA14_00180 [Saprospiraceae bacterium]|nr:hypothetical protein [Saprospiraceae bacterium]
MENKVPDHIPPKPGIAEAIHPEIGNGVSWETDLHQYLLRSPDPTKSLENLLADAETKTNIPQIEDQPETILIDSANDSSEIITSGKLTVVSEEIEPVTDDSFFQEENFVSLTPKKEKIKRDPKKKSKNQDTDPPLGEESPDQNEAGDNQPKTPKAGKLVRKAAKTVRKQEEDEQKAIKQDLTLTESTLSPYTQWLKGLRGSDYVHPYDDDFAFTQVTGPAKEGISETFAELLASQGYKDQAVEMYMKLMEKYPEKSGFFAAKIEALQ